MYLYISQLNIVRVQIFRVNISIQSKHIPHKYIAILELKIYKNST